MKSDFACVQESDFNVDNCEILWSSLKIANQKTLSISSFSRPPSSTTEILDHLSDSINNVFTKVPNHPNIIMGGDFNLGDIDWNQEIPSTSNPATAFQHDKFMHILDDYALLKFQLDLHLEKPSTSFCLPPPVVSLMYPPHLA